MKKAIAIIKARLKQSPKLLGVIFLLCLLAALVYSIMARPFNPQFVSFDMKGEIAAFQSSLSTSTLSVSQQQALAVSFMKLMTQDVNTYARTHNVVVLVKGAVVSNNLKDITPVIQQQLMAQIGANVQTLAAGS